MPYAVLLMVLTIMVAGCRTDDPAAPPDDPGEFAAELVSHARAADWDAMAPMLTDEYHAFDHETFRWLGLDAYPEDAEQPQSWLVEARQQFTIVRLEDQPHLSLLLRETNQSGWQYDPGPYQALVHRMRDENLEFVDGVPPWQWHVDSEDPAGAMQVLAASIVRITTDDDLEVTVEFFPRNVQDMEIDRTSIFWEVEDETIPATIHWTNAIMSDESLRFADTSGASFTYLTVRLEDVPDVDDVVLSMEGVRIASSEETTDETLIADHRFQIPVQEYPELESGALPDEDPREVAAQLVELALVGEWEAVRAQLTAPYQDYELETLAEHGPGRSLMFPEVTTDPEQWEIEEHNTFTVLRWIEQAPGVIVLRPIDGEWRYDPGLHQKLRMTMFEEDLERQTPEVQWRREVTSEDDALADRIFGDRILLGRVNEGLRVHLEFFPAAAETIEVARDDIYWEVDGEALPVEIYWATLAVDEQRIEIPQIGEGATYYATFLLEDHLGAESVELVLNSVTATGVEDDPDRTFDMDVRYHIPVEDFPTLVDAQ